MSKIAYRTDCYKTGHIFQYPEGTEQVFSNWTARKSRIPDVNHTIFFGLQAYIIKTLILEWKDKFFYQPKELAVQRYQRRMKGMGFNFSLDHIAALHDLGYLPVEIWALPEGSVVPIGVPSFVMFNTRPEFFWVTNYLETDMSANLWKPSTNATISREFRKLFVQAMVESGGPVEFVDWQGHDFSYRGMSGTEDAVSSGAAHLLSFNGTDTIPAIDFLEDYYGANSDQELIGGSVPATEHSVMCMGGQLDELETVERLIRTYPTGVLSVVSDTWDYWHMLTDILPRVKDQIMARNGTYVVRPDSGKPNLIICGDPKADRVAAQHGTFKILWDLFGGTKTAKDFKFLDSHIGAIYGDSITIPMARLIIDGLLAQKFVPSMVYGIGSYTYQMVTRDTFGHALKSTAGVVNGEVREIFKDPATDDGTKKSATGYTAVYPDREKGFVLKDRATLEEVRNCAYQLAFLDGAVTRNQTYSEIKNLVRNF